MVRAISASMCFITLDDFIIRPKGFGSANGVTSKYGS